MQKSEIKPVSEVVLKELINNKKEWQGRTYSLYEPVRGKRGEYITFILDEKTGLGTSMILPAMELALIDKPVILRIMSGVLKSLFVAIDKQGDVAAKKEPGYFKKNPVNAGKQHGEFAYEEKLSNDTTINYYVFKSIITDNKLIT